ncbi:hypothetical protein ASPCAL15077 [Aspergillus calidoustus]|uniref:Uncharacterized protein n=1 Tax=Aspergillus calidoustus TaxID=454130 RepID=A0A0U5GPN3_ASPCI|nr:hypothetical protein ASPCAL15077 [Aspergillus calidoustus]
MQPNRGFHPSNDELADSVGSNPIRTPNKGTTYCNNRVPPVDLVPRSQPHDNQSRTSVDSVLVLPTPDVHPKSRPVDVPRNRPVGGRPIGRSVPQTGESEIQSGSR